MNARMCRALVVVGVGLSLLPASVWAGCEDAPLFSNASTEQITIIGKTLVISARKKVTGCAGETLKMTVLGSPVAPSISSPSLSGEASATMNLPASSTAKQIFNVTYTVTDAYNHVNTVTLPITYGSQNTTPSLSPISDLTVPTSQLRSFSIEATDPDPTGFNLPLTEDALRVDGLPASAIKSYTRVTGGDFVLNVKLTPTTSERGIYRVTIRSKDGAGAMTIGQMRLEVY